MLNSPGAGLQNAMNSVGPGHSSATAINNATTHIDPSSMQKAFDALGLTYGSQSPAQPGQSQGQGQQNPQAAQHQQLHNMNSLGRSNYDLYICSGGIIMFKIHTKYSSALPLPGANQMGGGLGVPSSDHGMLPDSLPSTLNK